MFSVGTISICRFYSEGRQEGGNRAFVVRCSTNSHLNLAEFDKVKRILILLRCFAGSWAIRSLLELKWTSVCLTLE